MKIFVYQITFPDRGGGWVRPMLIGASTREDADEVMKSNYSEYPWKFHVEYEWKPGIIGGI